MKQLLAFLLSASCAFGAIVDGGGTVNVRKTTGYAQVGTGEFYPARFCYEGNAMSSDTTNDKAALQACIDAAEAAGGGIVQLGEGTYEIHPLATGIGLLVNGDKVVLRGVGPKTILRVLSSTSSVSAFEGIAPEGYNTATSAYGASGIWIEDLTIECDAFAYSTTANRNAHGLIGICHAPWAIIRNVTFGSVCYHQLEINRSRNVLVENCNFIGNTEGSRIQIDVAESAGIISAEPRNMVNESITFRNCRFAGRDLTGQTLAVPRLIENSHSSAQENKNITYENCEFGPVYHTTAFTAGYTMVNETAPRMTKNLTIRNCRFLGNIFGETIGLYLLPGSGITDGLVIENNYFGPGIDCAGTYHAGGFNVALAYGANLGANAFSNNSVATNYANSHGIVIRNNVFEPRFVKGAATVGYGSVSSNLFNVGPAADATITGNIITFPVYSSTFTAATSDILTTTGSGTTYGMRSGDPIRATTTTTLPGGMATSTTYYIREVLSSTTFTISATLGGAILDITSTGTGTHTWTNYLASVGLSYNVGFGICEVANLTFTNNTCIWQHSTAVTDTNCYSMIFRQDALETASATGFVDIRNNRVSEIGAGSVTIGLVEYDSGGVMTAPLIGGIVSGNVAVGTFTTNNSFQGHPMWNYYPDRMASTTLAAAATALAVTSPFVQVTGDAGANTLATITGGYAGMELTLLFVDSLVTITDTAAATANTVNLSAAFTSTASDTIRLRHDGTKWFEVARSVN